MELVLVVVVPKSIGIENPPPPVPSVSGEVPSGGDPSRRPLLSIPIFACAKAEPAKPRRSTEVTAISLRMIEIPSS